MIILLVGLEESQIAPNSSGNITPTPPTIIADDTANTITATSSLGTSEILVSINNAAYIQFDGVTINVGDVDRAAGYYKFKIKAATGRDESIASLSPAFTMTKVTPAAPTVVGDDTLDTLTASHTLGISEILVSENNLPYTQYTAPINVGNVARAAGYWKFKIKAATGRNESAVTDSPAFTVATVTPVAPTLTTDDIFNTISASHPLGTSEIIFSTNNGAFVQYTGTILVGDVYRAAGYYQFKTKAATGRNESPVSSSPEFTTQPVAPTVIADDLANTIYATHPLGDSEIIFSTNNGAFIPYAGLISVGNVSLPAGYYQFKTKAATGRSESVVSTSPAFTVAPNTTPVPPTITQDDAADTIAANHPLGATEILVNINNAGWTQYTGTMSVGDVNLPAGYFQFKIKSAPGRNESSVVVSDPFTMRVTPTPPTVVGDDVLDTLTASSPLGNSEIVVSINGAAYTPYTGTIQVGDVARAAGFWKFKIKAAPNRNESSVVDSPSFTVAVLITPDPPVLTADDVNNTLSASSPLGISEILVSINNAAYVQYTGVIQVGDVTTAIGYWKFKIKAAPGRNESAVASSPAFTANVTPVATTITQDDVANTISASHTLGISEILVSVNNGTYTQYTGTINAGNVALAAGYYKFKIKAAPNRNESPVASSAAFTVAVVVVTPDPPVLSADDVLDTLSASSPLGATEIVVSTNGGAYKKYTGTIAVGDVARPIGFWKFKIKAAVNRNESAVVDSPAFTVAIVTPAPPTVVGDDAANTLTASHPLGISEIVYSENGGTFVQYTGPISVGDVARPVGYWKFKTKAATNRNESATTDSPAFTIAVLITPDPPVITADDVANTLSASSPLGNSEIVYSTNNGSYVQYTGTINVGDVTLAAGYYKFKIKAAANRTESAVSQSPAFTANVTPVAPTITQDDTVNTISASHSLGTSEILVSINNAAYVQYTGTIQVGDVALAAGYYKFKTKAAAGRNESPVSSSAPFTVSVVVVTPAPPTVVGDDIANTLTASSPLGNSEILYSVNGGAYVQYVTTINVGDVALPIGYYKFKIKAATNRNESSVTDSPAFTVAIVTPAPPSVVGDDTANTLTASHPLGISEIIYNVNGGSFVQYTGPINVGNVTIPGGYYKFKTKAATNRNESATTDSPPFNMVVTPVAPTVVGDDVADTLTASHPLGTSEILVSTNNAAYVQYTGPIQVGNVARAVGYWKFKTKAATNRNESPVTDSPAFTVAVVTPAPPVVTGDDNANTLTASSPLGISEILYSENNAAYIQYVGVINVGNVDRPAGYYKFKIKAALNRNESSVVNSPAFTSVVSTGYTPNPINNSIAALPLPTTGTNYFISNAGSVNNTGLSANSPWPVSKVQQGYSGPMFSNANILFRAGETFYGKIYIFAAQGTNITYQSYGDGVRPIITTMREVPGSTVASNWTTTQWTNVWKLNVPNFLFRPRIYLNDVEGTRSQYPSGVNSSNRVSYTNDTTNGQAIFVYATSNPTTFYSSVKSANFDSSTMGLESSNVVLKNLDIRGGADATIDVVSTTGGLIQDCVIGLDANGSAIAFSNVSGFEVRNNDFRTGYNTMTGTNPFYDFGREGGDCIALFARNVLRNINVHHNNFYDWIHSAFWVEQQGGADKIMNNLQFRYNYVTAPNCWYARGFGAYGYDAPTSSVFVENNVFYDLKTQNQMACPGLLVNNNIIDTFYNGDPLGGNAHELGIGNGIQLGHGTYIGEKMTISNNQIKNCAQTGIYIGGEYNYGENATGPATKNNIISGNTFTNNGWNIINPTYEPTRSTPNKDICIMDRILSQANAFTNNVFNRAATDKCIFYGHDPANSYEKTVTQFNGMNGTSGDVISGNAIQLA